MKNKGRVLSCLVSVLLFSLVLASIPDTGAEPTPGVAGEVVSEVNPSGVAHDPILIGCDSDFITKAAEESWTGNGSVSSPFIIEGFDIDLDGASGNCITIENTTLHFIVRDCYLEGATQPNYAGIHLWNVTNGNILDNRCFNTSHGIYGSATYSAVSNNVINVSSAEGISMTQTHHTQISGNELIGTNGGLRLSSGSYNEIRGNIVEVQAAYAIRISTTGNSTISENQCSGGTIAGMLLLASDNNTLEENDIHGNFRGLVVESSDLNGIISSTLRANYDGLYIYDSYANLVHGCNISDNTHSGVVETMASAANLIFWNEFVNNTGHILDESSGTSHYEYNYYDDCEGADLDANGYIDMPYVIPLYDEVDAHPLVYKPTGVEWDPAPTNQVIELGEAFYYDLNVTSASPVVDWRIDNSPYFMVDSEGIITDKGNLAVGFYFLEIYATNLYGFNTGAGFSITVEDTTNPIWITAARNRHYNYGNWIEFQIAASDEDGIETWTINDDENFTLHEESYGAFSMATIVNNYILSSGEYMISLEVFDPSGNSVRMNFTITVAEAETSSGTGLDLGVLLSVVGISVAALALLLSTCAYMGTKRRT